MMSWQTLYSTAGNLVSDNTTSTLNFLKQQINQTQQSLLALRKDFTETSITDTTVSGQQNYYLPYNYGKMFYVTVTVGSIVYPVTPCEDDMLWRTINARSTVYKSDIPTLYYIFNDQLFIYPKPASAGNTITMYYHKTVKDMTADDYTTGTITTATNGSAAIVGNGTSWTTAMIGRFLRITADGYWYEIAGVADTTHLTLKKVFQGTSIVAGSNAYTIGELPLIPEAYQELLIQRPVAQYLTQRLQEELARTYWMQYDGGFSIGLGPRTGGGKIGGLLARFIEDRSNKNETGIIDSKLRLMSKNVGILDPNAFPLNLSS